MLSVVGAAKGRHIGRWLESLARHDVEVVLVDGGDVKGTEGFPLTRVEVEVDGLFPDAWMKNVGIRAASHDIVCCTNTDIAYSDGFFAEVEKRCELGVLVQAMRITAPQGSIVYPNAAIQRNGQPLKLLVDPDCDSVVLPVTAAGDCQALHKRDWDDLTGYNEAFRGWGGLDSELQCRALLGGLSVHVIGYSVVSHVHRWHPPNEADGEQEENAQIVRDTLMEMRLQPNRAWGQR